MRSAKLNSPARRLTQALGPSRAVAALAAFFLSTTALPAFAAVTDGATLEVAPDAIPGVAPQRPGAGQVVQAPPDRTIEYVLPDGTALTLAPGSSLTITRYEYDPARRAGELGLELGSGLFRIAGGAINNATPITLSTGGGAQGCQMALANGTAVVAADSTGAVRTYLLFGERLTVTSGDETAPLVRPGFQLGSACRGDAPDESPLSEAQLSADLIQLNPGLLAVLAPGAGDEDDDDAAEVIPALATEDRQREREGEPTRRVPPGSPAGRSQPRSTRVTTTAPAACLVRQPDRRPDHRCVRSSKRRP